MERYRSVRKGVMIEQRATCDSPKCEATRREVNHWFAVTELPNGLLFQTWDQAAADGNLERSKHFCGQTHALQFVSERMEK